MKSLLALAALVTLGAASANASTSAFVYETADVPNTNSSVQAIYGYALSSSGQLAPIPGGPFGVGDGINYYTASNGTYLFGISWGNPNNPTWQNIITYRIAGNGALTKVQTTPAARFASTSGNHFLYGPLALDHSGQFLYVGVTGGSDLYSDYSVMTFQVNHETGALDYIGDTPFHGQDTSTIHFTGDDKYAFDGNNYEYMVAGNKTLRLLGNATDAGFNGNFLDTDPLSNLAVLDNGQLQSWLVHADGNLSEHSTGGQSLIQTNLWPYDYSQMYFSPDGSILALAGFGLDLYHFNGARPITNYKQLYAPGVFDSQNNITAGTFVYILGWDTENHFITVNYDQPDYPKAAGPWYWEIYNATSTSVTQAYRAELPQQNYYGFTVQRLGTSPAPLD